MDLSTRCSGVLLHFTSLPGRHGAGDLGGDAHRFVDWLVSAGQTLWQALPAQPIGPGHSPYQSPSAFAGNPLLVALEPLVQRGWLAPPVDVPAFAPRQLDFDAVAAWRTAQLQAAAAGFAAGASAADRETFAAWRRAQAAWLDDFTLYAALRQAHGRQPWWQWPTPLRKRQPAALRDAAAALADDIAHHAFVQWCFDEQAAALKRHANARGVRLMGDMPIFVAHDSADVWADPGSWQLDDSDAPTVVAGVPPDVYTADGQRWGNPLYRWERMAAAGYAWWAARIRRVLLHNDVFRLDHFRGFAGCWEIPAASPTARDGRWVPGPGAALFEALHRQLGALPIVAEDLGTITPDVEELQARFNLPGMRIVHEGLLHGAGHAFLPHNHPRAGLAYTSTHDSNTVRGWWQRATPGQRAFAAAYLGLQLQDDGNEPIAWAVLRATLTSVSNLALAPMQDLLDLGEAARMNLPGTSEGNWGWRFDWNDVPADLAPRLRELTRISGRLPA